MSLAINGKRSVKADIGMGKEKESEKDKKESKRNEKRGRNGTRGQVRKGK